MPNVDASQGHCRYGPPLALPRIVGTSIETPEYGDWVPDATAVRFDGVRLMQPPSMAGNRVEGWIAGLRLEGSYAQLLPPHRLSRDNFHARHAPRDILEVLWTHRQQSVLSSCEPCGKCLTRVGADRKLTHLEYMC